MEDVFQDKLTAGLSRFKDNIAVEYGSETVTYADVDRQSNGIANWIMAKGINKETFIGIYTVDRVRLINAITGILKAGCVFVPLDPALPKNRLEAMIEMAGLTLILRDAGENENWNLNRDRGVEWVSWENLFSRVDPRWYREQPGVDVTPEDKIYVYFTSGTTGKPKAIVGKNKSLVHFIDWEIETFAVPPGFRVSQWITPGFDAFLRDVFVTLCSGGTLCIPPSSDILLDSYELIQWTDKTSINLVHCVPSLFRLLNSDTLTPSHFQALKYVLLSGETINPSELVNWYDTFDERIQLVNFYGPTETTMIKTYHLIGKKDMDKERIPIGVPMKGARVIILDEEKKICDELITGEIYIRTPFRTFGYYNDDQLNREKFVPNPLSNDPLDIVFKTGDLGRFLPGGTIEFLGRKDRQVKIRGVRVELEEIEHALLNHPSVTEAAVIKKEISSSNELLCAYVTFNEKFLRGVQGGGIFKKSPPGDLKDYLEENLPDYMVPAVFMTLEKIPLTPNGKIDINALPEPQAGETGLQCKYIAPRSRGEDRLAAIWSGILGIKKESIGIDHNFFQLGGQSLNATMMLAKIHKELEVRVPLAEILTTPTIRRLSQYIDAAEKEKINPIEPAESREFYPLSSAQKRLYVVQQMEPGSSAYNIPSVVTLEGDIKLQRVEQAFKALVHRHESFRTSFQMVAEEPVQVVHHHRDIEFSIEYLNHEGHEGEEEFNDFIHCFELSQAPLLRVGIIKAGKNKHILAVDMHHIISDGLSMNIFVREFVKLYGGEELAPLALQYKDFSQWQGKEREKGVLKKQEEFWLRQFAGPVPRLKLPGDYTDTPVPSFEGSLLTVRIDEELAVEVERAAAQTGTTLNLFLLAVFNILLSRYSMREDILVGCPVSGRSHTDFQQAIGMFVNMLAMRNRPAGDKTFRQFLEEVKTNAFAAYENQDYPFEELVVRLGLQGESGKNPLFDVAFTLHTPDSVKIESYGLKVSPFQFESKVSIFDLTLRAFEAPGTLALVFEYKTARFKASTIEKYAKRYIEILEQVVEDNTDILLKDITVSHELLSLEPGILTGEENDFRF